MHGGRNSKVASYAFVSLPLEKLSTNLADRHMRTLDKYAVLRHLGPALPDLSSRSITCHIA